MLKNYKELKVWQKSYKLCLKTYRITAKFPKEKAKVLQRFFKTGPGKYG
jgi:hypothetical protein